MSFTPVNVEKAKILEQKMAESPLFQSPEKFVEYYNQGLINKSNELVSKIADELINIYVDLERNNREIRVLCQEEVILNSLEHLIEDWRIFVELKGVLQTLIKSGDLRNDGKIAFVDENSGFVSQVIEDEASEGFVYNRVARFRLFGQVDKLEQKIRQYGIPYNKVDNGIVLNVVDVLNKDTSVLFNLKNLL